MLPIAPPTGRYRTVPEMPPIETFLSHGEAPSPDVFSPPVKSTAGPKQLRAAVVIDAVGVSEGLLARCLRSIQSAVEAHSLGCTILSDRSEFTPAVAAFLTHGERRVAISPIETMSSRFDHALRLHSVGCKWLIWIHAASCAASPDWIDWLLPPEKNTDKVGAAGVQLQHQLVSLTPGKDPRAWFAMRDWYGKRHFRNKLGVEAPNGAIVHYLDPRFFAVNKTAAADSHVPDVDAGDAAFAIVLGEQLHQNGWTLAGTDHPDAYISLGPSTLSEAEPPWI